MKSLALFSVLTLSAFSALAEPCLDNFTSEGNLLTGRTYKTWAVLPGVRQQDAYVRAYAFTVGNGFTVLSASKEAGAISAAQSTSYGNGKTIPLSITMVDDGTGTRVNMSYATSMGVMSPMDAIKRHFCMTIAAASTGSGSPAAGPAVGAMPAQRPAPRGFAQATPEQQLAIKQELMKNLPSENIRKLATDAAPTISAFIERLACLADPAGGSALDEYAAPGVGLGAVYATMGPMRAARYHNKGSCMTVMRVHGWTAPANNALQFEVVYKAEDSGETAKSFHEFVRQPDGAWMYTR